MAKIRENDDEEIYRRKVYVGAVPLNATQEGLRAAMAIFGEVENVNIMVRAYNPKNLATCAFVTYAEESSALRAISKGVHPYSGSDRSHQLKLGIVTKKVHLSRLRAHVCHSDKVFMCVCVCVTTLLLCSHKSNQTKGKGKATGRYPRPPSSRHPANAIISTRLRSSL